MNNRPFITIHKMVYIWDEDRKRFSIKLLTPVYEFSSVDQAAQFLRDRGVFGAEGNASDQVDARYEGPHTGHQNYVAYQVRIDAMRQLLQDSCIT